jgi:drug/metabolite transporter (DMT)-like permease
MTWSYKLERAATAAAASYTSLLWAFAIDVAVFSLLPGINALVGGALVLASGALVLWGSSLSAPVVLSSEPGGGR